MALQFVDKWFSKVGRGVPQVELVDEEGKPIIEDGKPKIGNEQYQAKQLTDDSVASDTVENFVADVLEAVSGDLELAASCFRSGFNKDSRLKAGGLDEYQKAARGVIKLGLPWTKGLSVDEVADKLREMNG